MASQYIEVEEAPQYGLKSITDAQLIKASTLIDAYLGRPEGLVYAPDFSGNPSYMAALSPSVTFKLTQPIDPGSSVPVSLNGPIGILQMGDVLILDRATGTGEDEANVCEACTVATTTAPGTLSPQITLQTVQNSHIVGATADLGLVIEEQKYMPDGRPLTMVSRTPLMNILSGVGRYAYERRGAVSNWNMEQFNLLAAVTQFGGPPIWEMFQQNYQSQWDVQTGQVWVPAGVMLAYYSEVKLRYVAGFQASAIPTQIKFAVAELIHAMASTPPMGDIKSFKAGDTAYANFTSSRLSADTKRLIARYMVNSYN